MKTSTSIVTLLVLIAILAGLYLLQDKYGQPTVPPVTEEEGVFCTMDAMMCPDGSYVGRVAPSCQFAACPATTATTSMLLETRINQETSALGVSLTPLEVVEDSRCPINALCIQAGTVRLRASLMTDSGIVGSIVTETFTLGQPIIKDGREITFTMAQPSTHTERTIAPSEYVFTFSVKTR
jgi:hypothetical protein